MRTGTCVGLFSTAGGSRLLRAPFWLPKEWDLALHRRKAGLYLNQGYPLTLEEEFEFALPAKAQPAVLPGVSENSSAPLRWRVEWTKIGDDKLSARMRAELARGELSAEPRRRLCRSNCASCWPRWRAARACRAVAGVIDSSD